MKEDRTTSSDRRKPVSGSAVTHGGQDAKASAQVRPYVVNNLSGTKTGGNTFYFLGWTARSDKNPEYDDLVSWIENK